MRLNLDRYAEVFFDLDGVLVNTNAIKKRNIGAAAEFKGQQFCREFVDYFTANNGVPREAKVEKFFPREEAEKVLLRYAELNSTTLHEAEIIPGAEDFLQEIGRLGKPIHVFTGATEDEAVALLSRLDLRKYFAGVHGGPRTKKENFSRGTHSSPVLMFGDSRSDYGFAQFCGFEFVFVFGFTQFTSWREFFEEHPILGAIPDFCSLSLIEAPNQKQNYD